ncbi:hypothetical protein H0H81_010636 [Sphagnurus paluster]|uniref:Autophagy-related protein 2 n=1 Tax=Sphagnurus paluster TaxID=117069 RepID=A0A9P7GQ00_9AGAR|nr:hypothetical protein H0H81_010636 [Sphagnurus paluster]
MFPWYSAWLPGLPSINFALPAGLQGRFISFVLKKTLGHFLRPGQLDLRQIDSQIGSGFVQVNDLELDNEAINDLISDLPVVLHDGFISSVVARVPWPNPLTSTLGFSVDSLCLTFHVLPTSSRGATHNQNLAESVASVAESFLHDELSPQGETLWDSMHPNIAARKQGEDPTVPGGLGDDPFLSHPEEVHPDLDPAGVSIFTTLIERLLARFEFHAFNTKVTIVHPGNMSITASIADIRYRTDDTEGTPGFALEGDTSIGRTLSITGFNVVALNLRHESASTDLSVSNLRTPPPLGLHSAPSSQTPVSPSSSSSSLDEETQFSMTQSLAFLPPRPVSPASSPSSSMYQSAISTASTLLIRDAHHNHAPPSSQFIPPRISTSRVEPTLDDRTDTLLSFGTSPILVQVRTPSPALPETEPSFSPNNSSSFPSQVEDDESLRFTVTFGVVACALQAWHVRGLLALINGFTVQHTVDNPDTPLDSVSMKSSIDIRIALNIRAVVLLVPLPSFRDQESRRMALFADFFKWPLVPPVLPHGYLRLRLDSISTSISSLSSQKLLTKRAECPRSVNARSLSSVLTVGDISLFSMYESSSTQEPAFFASPILFTDRELPAQYSVRHDHPNSSDLELKLPVFEVVDWTAEKYHSNGLKLSSWRTKPPSKQNQAQEGTSPSAIVVNFSNHVSKISKHRTQDATVMEIKVTPFHILLDVGNAFRIDRVIAFLDEAFSQGLEPSYRARQGQPATNNFDGSDNDKETPPSSPRMIASPRRDYSQRNLSCPPLDDVGLTIDDDTKQYPQEKRITHSDLKTSVVFEMIRIQIRCPPPPQRSPRSGALVIDLRDIKVYTSPKPQKSTRFTPAESQNRSHTHPPQETFVLGAEFGRLVVACSPVHESSAKSMISVGPLAPTSDNLNIHQVENSLQPRLSVTKSNPITPELDTISALRVEIPSVVVEISKAILDSLQYWADDITQVIDKSFRGEPRGDNEDASTEKAGSRDTSLIGSRFFAKSRSGSGSALSVAPEDSHSETVVKVSISDAYVRAMVYREQEHISSPFIIYASDMDLLLELRPEGKDETVLTLGVLDLTIKNIPTPQSIQTLISLSSPRSLALASRSMVKLRFTSLVVPGTSAKESRVKLTLSGFTFNFYPDFSWAKDLAVFVKSPAGVFESVVPSERTRIFIKICDGAIRVLAPNHRGAVVVHIDELEFATDVVGDSPDTSFRLFIPALALLAVDDLANEAEKGSLSGNGVALWKSAGFALLAEIGDLSMSLAHNGQPTSQISVDRARCQVHICADTLAAVAAFASDLGSAFKSPEECQNVKPIRGPTLVSTTPNSVELMASVDDLAFKKVPAVGPAPDMIFDDLPTNMDYLDESFGTAAGLRELRDDDLDEFEIEETSPEYSNTTTPDGIGIISRVGGETIKLLRSEGIHVTENFYDSLPPDTGGTSDEAGATSFRVRVRDSDITLCLYDGYDWPKTRKTIEEGVKDMRRRLAKIRQLVASGQAQDPTVEDTSSLLFNSLYIGLEHDVNGLEPGAIIAAIDEELNDNVETESQSSWQSLKSPTSRTPHGRSMRLHGKRLTRSLGPSMEFHLFGLSAEIDRYLPDTPVVSRTLATVRDLEILDHIKTSTWKKFLTELRSDSRGNTRETESNMVRIELRSVRPVPNHPVEEARLRAKILPLRLYVDQDAVDFLKVFFSFKDPHASPVPESDAEEIYFQSAEVFPVDLKLDYKPRRVDYRALREGRTIELMNFFHFDGAEMTLRHITLAGITGWPRFFDLLNDLWTPDVKATQLVEVISGVAPIRSVVNVGSGVADLVLLPISQYKKDGRIVRGVQKGTTAFVKSTALEAIKLGARLATGTQVILEQAEGVLGGHFDQSITAEAVQTSTGDDFAHFETDDDAELDAISKYAQQPDNIKEGVQSAYKSLRKNFNSAAQTILAVPMEVYERSGNEGAVRSVIRAVPIAVLKPMIGASEAVSKTLLGLHNTLDPDLRHENEAKYKQRQ